MIIFGICTFNRKEILEKSARSLYEVKGIESVTIRVYDDCSTEYDLEYLRKIFPTADKIVRSRKNGGADINTSIMYEDFLGSDADWLFNADSDLIYRTDIVECINKTLNKCNGFMTVFNCINHKTIGEKGDFLLKDSVGAAGCLLNREVVRLILSNIKYRKTGFDVGFSKLLRKKDYDLLSVKESLVQHIGVSGFNSRNINFDYGEAFICDSAINAEIIEDTFEKYVKSVQNYRSTNSWKIHNFVVSLPRRIKKYTRIAIEMIVDRDEK